MTPTCAVRASARKPGMRCSRNGASNARGPRRTAAGAGRLTMPAMPVRKTVCGFGGIEFSAGDSLRWRQRQISPPLRRTCARLGAVERAGGRSDHETASLPAAAGSEARREQQPMQVEPRDFGGNGWLRLLDQALEHGLLGHGKSTSAIVETMCWASTARREVDRAAEEPRTTRAWSGSQRRGRAWSRSAAGRFGAAAGRCCTCEARVRAVSS